MIETTAFRIRAYGVGELAVCYNAHLTRRAAIMQLWRWINYQHALKDKLAALGYRPGLRSFTPKMVACIVEHLGEP